MFDGLATLCVDLKAKAEVERAQNAVDLSVFASLVGDTQVGRLVAALSAATKPADVEALARLDADESARHVSLGNSLKENDPKEKAAQLQLRERRVEALEGTVCQRAAAVSTASIAEIERRAKRLTEAKAAAKLAAEEFSAGGKLLPGTGKSAWRALFEAAREFARESHPHEVFPTLSSESPCPLCQQPLEGGASLLPRFQAYIEQRAAREVEAASGELNALYASFSTQALNLNADPVLLLELDTMDSALSADVRDFEKAVLARQQSVIAAVGSGVWGHLAPEAPNPAKRLQQQSVCLRREREELLRASDVNARAALQAEFSELDARVRMGSFKNALLTAISKFQHIDKLDRCIKALNTRSISSKASELTGQAVSAELEEALNREFRALGVGSLQVSLQSRSFKGKPLHKLVLKLPKAPIPRDVLSEGEQRSIALGSFLAEVGLGGGKGPVVFDDPVSSLDHRRRDAVARRLVAEAKTRQVIVFTHCLYFLRLLDEQAEHQEVPLLTQSLIQTAEGYGIAENDGPYEAKGTSKRVGALLQLQQRIAKLQKLGNETARQKETVDAYRLLRNAWERAVEELLFNNVVLRFRYGVETNRLADVRVEDSDYDIVNEGMTRCSHYAHDNAILGGTCVPEPDELLKDIRDLETWRRSVDERNKATAKVRKRTARAAESQVPPATGTTT